MQIKILKILYLKKIKTSEDKIKFKLIKIKSNNKYRRLIQFYNNY